MLKKYHASNFIRKGPNSNSLTEKSRYIARYRENSRKSYMFEDYEVVREQYIKCLHHMIILVLLRFKKYNDVKKELNEKNKIIDDISSENIDLKNK